MNFEQACDNMISQQLRTNQVTDGDLLDLIRAGKREEFVPPHYRELAYADVPLEIGEGQVMMIPMDEGRMLKALSPRATDRILEVGTGTGYITALLARLAHDVVTIDNRQTFTSAAEKKLNFHNIHNVHFIHGDIFQSTFSEGFDVIAVTGSVPVVPQQFKKWLNLGGRLFVIAGNAPKMEALCITRISQEEWQPQFLFETSLRALDNSPHTAGFRF